MEDIENAEESEAQSQAYLEENPNIADWLEQGGAAVDAYFEQLMYPEGTPAECDAELEPEVEQVEEDTELEQNVKQIEDTLMAVGRMTLDALEQEEVEQP